jgi:ribosomal protein S18 acetylase RimI-like enzyme
MNIIADNLQYRPASIEDIDALITIEDKCFSSDKLSRRSFRRFITNKQSTFLICCHQSKVIGYLLIVFHRGTRLARLYSMAVLNDYRGLGISTKLLKDAENLAIDKGALYLRLEVNTTNYIAIALYKKLYFREFALIEHYYEDQSDAIRMQKRIRHFSPNTTHQQIHKQIPWFKQNTPFTCGPAALMMALSALDKTYLVTLEEELELWREATTIFMTSGHGGCHPVGLALAAQARGFKAKVNINSNAPLFVDGVRSEDKKQIITTVHEHFIKQSKQKKLAVSFQETNAEMLKSAFDQGQISLVLISTYRLDRKKAPHWVVISGYDEQCFYLHDPDPDEKFQDHNDCQYVPIRFDDFERMSAFGTSRMRTSIQISLSEIKLTMS